MIMGNVAMWQWVVLLLWTTWKRGRRQSPLFYTLYSSTHTVHCPLCSVWNNSELLLSESQFTVDLDSERDWSMVSLLTILRARKTFWISRPPSSAKNKKDLRPPTQNTRFWRRSSSSTISLSFADNNNNNYYYYCSFHNIVLCSLDSRIAYHGCTTDKNLAIRIYTRICSTSGATKEKF